MSLFRQFEHRIESAVEGLFGSLFRGRVQPAEIASRLERELEDHKVVGPNSVFGPNQFDIILHPDDRSNLEPALPVILPELESFLRDTASEKNIRLAGTVRVQVLDEKGIAPGTISVRSRMSRDLSDSESVDDDALAMRQRKVKRSIVMRDGNDRIMELERDSIMIGRSEDADLRFDERAVSRQHAQLVWDGDRTILEDLNSTNGTFVNGQRITQCVLNPGDVVRIGTRTFEYRIVRTI